MEATPRRTNRRRYIVWMVIAAACAIGFGIWLVRSWDSFRFVRVGRVYDEEVQQEDTKSVDLASDRERMWMTVPGVGNPSSEFEVSPVSAINAAKRVFATVEL